MNSEYLTIKHPTPSDTSSVLILAKNTAFIAPNTRMIYYLACSIYSQYSLIAKYKNEVVGFIFSMPDTKNNSLWIHQVFIKGEFQRQGVATLIAERFESMVIQNQKPDSILCAIKEHNNASKQFVKNLGLIAQNKDEVIDMIIFKKVISI